MSAKPRIVFADTPTPRRAKKCRRGRKVGLRVMGVGADEEGGLRVEIEYTGHDVFLRVPGGPKVAVHCTGDSYRKILNDILGWADPVGGWGTFGGGWGAFAEAREVGHLSLAEQFALFGLVQAAESSAS